MPETKTAEITIEFGETSMWSRMQCIVMDVISGNWIVKRLWHRKAMKIIFSFDFAKVHHLNWRQLNDLAMWFSLCYSWYFPKFKLIMKGDPIFAAKYENNLFFCVSVCMSLFIAKSQLVQEAIMRNAKHFKLQHFFVFFFIHSPFKWRLRFDFT